MHLSMINHLLSVEIIEVFILLFEVDYIVIISKKGVIERNKSLR